MLHLQLGMLASGQRIQGLSWKLMLQVFWSRRMVEGDSFHNHSAITIKNPQAGKGGLLFGLHALNQKFYFGHYNPDDSWDKYMMVIDAISGNVGIGTDNPQAKLEVAGAIRLAPSSQPSNPQEGMMYYDSSLHKFMCATDKGWQDCGGAGEVAGGELTVPVKIWDSNKTRLVLEITEE